MLKKRHRLLAVGLHLFSPGLGFLYTGHFWVALLTPLLLIFSVFALAWSRLLLEPWGVWAIWGGVAFIYIALIPVVFFSTKNKNPRALKCSPCISVYLGFILTFVSAIALMVHYRATLFGYETFHLPSSSMANTLLPNDYIIVDTWAYDAKKPKRGDIIVFKYPVNPEVYFTKRLIAEPGDHVEITQGRVKVNDAIIAEPYVLKDNNKRTRKQAPVVQQIPEQHYYVLGDNRDQSNDSRMWGTLKQSNIYGKAVSIWFSFSVKEGIRLSRIKRLK